MYTTWAVSDLGYLGLGAGVGENAKGQHPHDPSSQLTGDWMNGSIRTDWR